MSDIERILEARDRDLGGGMIVGRVLPSGGRFLGPFAFFDHMRSAEPISVRPHPHINLATITYLFQGEIVHRDSLGSHQSILPGDINWMSAGSGIVHSERGVPGPLHGLQIWVALPTSDEESAPFFEHYAAASIPIISGEGVTARVLAGAAYGMTSPARIASKLFYVDVELAPGAKIEVPSGFAERGAYVIEGAIDVAGDRVAPRCLAVFATDTVPILEAVLPTRLVLIGGDALDGPRYIWWNFVSSSKERIVRATQEWRAGKFPKVPEDEVEFIPAPEGPLFVE